MLVAEDYRTTVTPEHTEPDPSSYIGEAGPASLRTSLQQKIHISLQHSSHNQSVLWVTPAWNLWPAYHCGVRFPVSPGCTFCSLSALLEEFPEGRHPSDSHQSWHSWHACPHTDHIRQLGANTHQVYYLLYHSHPTNPLGSFTHVALCSVSWQHTMGCGSTPLNQIRSEVYQKCSNSNLQYSLKVLVPVEHMCVATKGFCFSAHMPHILYMSMSAWGFCAVSALPPQRPHYQRQL